MTAESPHTRFGLLRHAKTVWNQEHRVQGRLDSPLTEKGRAACDSWAGPLTSHEPAWNRMVVSPLQRARDTAGIINRRLVLPVHEDDDLREQDWGAWEGLTIADIKAEFGEYLERGIRQGWGFRPPGGESREEVLMRARACLLRCAAAWPGERILVVTHLGVIKSLLYHLSGRAFLPEEPKISWSERFHVIRCTDGRLAIEQTEIPLSDPQ